MVGYFYSVERFDAMPSRPGSSREFEHARGRARRVAPARVAPTQMTPARMAWAIACDRLRRPVRFVIS
ncbi:hypothetical protein GCM10009634_50860 [Saccharothrix xinjiangensis]